MGEDELDDQPPPWWPYAAELPAWYVWRGISGLLYGRKRASSPPLVVRGEDAVDLRDQVRAVILTCPELTEPGSG